MTLLFISHNLSVVEHLCDDVMVMYLGRIVELGSRAQVFENPHHAYTQSLLRAIPVADPTKRKNESELNFKPIPSPIFDIGYEPKPSIYDEVEPGHFVLQQV